MYFSTKYEATASSHLANSSIQTGNQFKIPLQAPLKLTLTLSHNILVEIAQTLIKQQFTNQTNGLLGIKPQAV